MNLSPGSPDGAMGLPGAAVTSPGREKSPARKRRRQKGGAHGGARPNAGRPANNALLATMSKASSVNPTSSTSAR